MPRKAKTAQASRHGSAPAPVEIARQRRAAIAAERRRMPPRQRDVQDASKYTTRAAREARRLTSFLRRSVKHPVKHHDGTLEVVGTIAPTEAEKTIAHVRAQLDAADQWLERRRKEQATMVRRQRKAQPSPAPLPAEGEFILEV